MGVIGAVGDRNPGRLVAQHKMGPRRCRGQRRVDRGGHRIDRIGVAGVVDPQRRAAGLAEAAPARAITSPSIRSRTPARGGSGYVRKDDYGIGRQNRCEPSLDALLSAMEN